MHYSLNSFEKKGNDIVQNLDGTLNLILSMVNADHVQLLFEPDDEGNFNQSLCVFKTQKPEPSLIKTLSSICRKITFNGNEFVELSDLGSNKSNRNGQTAKWWSLPLYLKEKRRAILNIALAEPSDCLKILSHYLTVLLLPVLSKPSVGLLLPKDQALSLSDLESQIAQAKDKNELYDLIRTHLGPHLGFKSFTIYLLDEQEYRLLNFFPDFNSPEESIVFKQVMNLNTLSCLDASPGLAYPNHHEALEIDLLEGMLNISPFLVTGGSPNKQGYLTKLCDTAADKGIIVFEISGHTLPDMVNLPAYTRIINAITHAALSLKQDYDIEQARSEAIYFSQFMAHLTSSDTLPEFLNNSTPLLQNLFNFDHQALAIVDQDRLIMTILQDGSSLGQPAVYEDPQEINGTISVGDRLINRALFSREPMFFDLELLSLRNALPSYFSDYQRDGISRVLMISLNGSEQVLGLWMICLSAGQYLSTAQLLQLRSIGDEIASKFGCAQTITRTIKINRDKNLLAS